MSNEREAVKEFTKRPVTISAIQWTGDNLRAVITFIEGAVVTNDLASAARWDDYRDPVEKRGIVIKNLEGQHIASVGDWIIKGVKGEHYPCKPDIFEMTYAPAQQSAPAGYVMEKGLADALRHVKKELDAGCCEDIDYAQVSCALAAFDQFATALKAEQPHVQEPVATVTIQHFRQDPSMENLEFQLQTPLPQGTHKLYASPVTKAVVMPERTQAQPLIKKWKCRHSAGEKWFISDHPGYWECVPIQEAQPADAQYELGGSHK